MKKPFFCLIIFSFTAAAAWGQVIQAENMEKVTEGGASPVVYIREDDVAFFSNGTIKTTFNGSGDYKLKFTVRTSTSGAHFRIQPPNLAYKDFLIDNQQYATFETIFEGLQPGVCEFSFTNDIHNNEGDRNLFLDFVEFVATGEIKKVNVCLSWSPNAESDLAGYKVSWGLASGNYIQSQDVGNKTLVCLEGFSVGFTYYFTVSAYNSKGLESKPSNEFPLKIVGPN